MYKFGEKHPYILQIILTLIAFGLAIAAYYVGQYLGYPPVFTFLLGMIAVGLLLMLIFIKAFIGENLSPGGSADLLALCYFLHFLLA